MFFRKSKGDKSNEAFIKIAALLIHAAKIDENYSSNEEEIIKKTLINIGANEKNIEIIIQEGKKIETDSNHILDFTKEVKNMHYDDKTRIVESLWRIIYSNKEADIYEMSLMRRLAGLLYIDSKTMGDIKNRIKNENL